MRAGSSAPIRAMVGTFESQAQMQRAAVVGHQEAAVAEQGGHGEQGISGPRSPGWGRRSGGDGLGLAARSWLPLMISSRRL